MKLADLRDHLDQQAARIDGTENAGLDAVRRKATRIRRVRVATAAAGTAAVIALAVGIVPSVFRADRLSPVAPSPTVPSSAPQTPDGLPSRVPPTSPNDYVRDGARFRARIADSTLRAAMIGAPGQTSIGFTASPDGPQMTLRYFCSASIAGAQFEVLVDDERRDFGPACPAGTPQEMIEAGGSTFAVDGPARIQARLVDKDRRPVADPLARLGVGAYALGAYRAVGNTLVPEVLEHNGYDYRLVRLEHSPARNGAGHELATPAGKPFLVVWGNTGEISTGFDHDGIETPSGRDGEQNGGPGWSIAPIASRKAGRVAVYGEGKHDKGEYVIGLYLPVG